MTVKPQLYKAKHLILELFIEMPTKMPKKCHSKGIKSLKQ